LVTIGDHVTLSAGVRLITHDGGVWVFRDRYPDLEVVAGITIGSNVFVGADSMLLAGSVVESDVIVGARSLVTGHLKSGGIYAGSPARFISNLDSYLERSLVRGSRTRGLPLTERRRILEGGSRGASAPPMPSD
jgi:acetyltransferase-like isoleucine patch superfamily enzyme